MNTNFLSTPDLILIAIFVVSILFHLFFLNRKKILSLLFAIYSSFIVINFLPFNLWLQDMSLTQITWLKVYIFLGLILFLMIVFLRSHVFANGHENIITKFFKKVIFGILNIGLIFSLLTILLPWDYINKFSDFFLDIFNKDLAIFIWVSAPLVFLIFSIRIKKRKGPGRPSLD